ncbi:Ldh family oxidoreductase [Microbulbifer sp. CAU 1566]|uniref:Ldh family oxidoreductase n=1 Tax=unclassified Microbulbifer TaxID=2619833 RepID=UPI00135CBA27|nr:MULTISPECIES: Ldh family oxidoreductase [unclassified Microbulbifer]MCK7598290.1 Ldh family oxidoreductase [Microbulbifer sp. CAU 1566]
MTHRYSAESLKQFASDLFATTGLAPERADVMAETFLQADLMGFTTHGLHRVASNLSWLEQGASRLTGEPHVLADRGNCFNWDADFLPGPWVVNKALDQALERVGEYGVVTGTIRRSQHIACLAAYLPKIVERNCVAILTCSTPAERTVSPQGCKTPLFSANPIAFCAPAADYPLLFDISMSVTAGGYVARAEREGKKLPNQYLKDRDGKLSDDPAAFNQGGSILPVGGADHGYKGAALSAMLEILSMGLGGYGRADAVADDDEANSVFLQVIDPAAFGSSHNFLRQVAALTQLWEACDTDDGAAPRVPGQRAWQLRSEQLANGVNLYPTIVEDLQSLAQRYGISMPAVSG